MQVARWWILDDHSHGAAVVNQRELDLLEAGHRAADELDGWDGDAVPQLDGMSPGGLVRVMLHEAAGVDIDGCPSCQERATWTPSVREI